MNNRLFFILLFFLCQVKVFSQDSRTIINGKILNDRQEPIPGVNITVEGTSKGVSSDQRGEFLLRLRQEDLIKNIIFSHIGYVEKIVAVQVLLSDSESDGSSANVTIALGDSVRILDQVNVTEMKEDELPRPASTFELNPMSAQFTPAPFQDISGILITLPGVSSSNEFSTAYAVRGGNYDENLVYVNNIPVYRPQIITSGRQEGLSFVNTDLVHSIEFSSGGWESKYGDGLASTLNIDYKDPEKFGGSFSIGLLGGSVHFEGASKNNRFSYLVGARHKRSEYLLNTLETEGEYRPRFTDVQTWLNYKFNKRTELGVLLSYAQNRYFVQPTSRETTFGTFEDQKRLFVAFEGQERLSYDTWQSGIRLSHLFNNRWRTHFIISGTYSREREYYDIESGYLLCNVDNNPASEGFNKCLVNIGIGTNYYSGRNVLDASLLNLESRNEIVINPSNTFEFGMGYAYHAFDDRLNEYDFVDSADYVTIQESVQSENNIEYARIHAYVQNTTNIQKRHSITYGLRMLYQSFGNDLLFSPRVQYSWEPGFMRNTYIRASAGVYHQAPFYREFRNPDGQLNKDLKAQSSAHGIVGLDYNFTQWNRPFKFTTEIYYKYLWNVNPYDIENVRIRYYGENIAKAFATGIDFRVSGEFIPGDESWFSLGLLSTKEDLDNDERGYIPRPMDRRVNLAIFFQDHIPKVPSFRVHLRLLYSSGLPFSPPVNPENRNKFRGGEYQRIDVGFSKIFEFTKRNPDSAFKSFWISAEVLNLTGNQNIISYYWVNDVNNNYYAVPNSLSQRFFNIRCTLKF